jgi:hypothetical protein
MTLARGSVVRFRGFVFQVGGGGTVGLGTAGTTLVFCLPLADVDDGLESKQLGQTRPRPLVALGRHVLRLDWTTLRDFNKDLSGSYLKRLSDAHFSRYIVSGIVRGMEFS